MGGAHDAATGERDPARHGQGSRPHAPLTIAAPACAGRGLDDSLVGRVPARVVHSGRLVRRRAVDLERGHLRLALHARRRRRRLQHGQLHARLAVRAAPLRPLPPGRLRAHQHLVPREHDQGAHRAAAERRRAAAHPGRPAPRRVEGDGLRGGRLGVGAAILGVGGGLDRRHDGRRGAARTLLRHLGARPRSSRLASSALLQLGDAFTLAFWVAFAPDAGDVDADAGAARVYALAGAAGAYHIAVDEGYGGALRLGVLKGGTFDTSEVACRRGSGCSSSPWARARGPPTIPRACCASPSARTRRGSRHE